MCNDFGNRVPYDAYVEEFADLRIPLVFPPDQEPEDALALHPQRRRVVLLRRHDRPRARRCGSLQPLYGRCRSGRSSLPHAAACGAGPGCLGRVAGRLSAGDGPALTLACRHADCGGGPA